MSISTQLWRENSDLAAAALGHGFVRALADGSLPRESFATYTAQDAYFLESFARAYALALARSADRESLEAFAGLLDGVIDELRLHSSYAQELGIDLAATQPSAATLAYTDFLLATAAIGGIGLTCAAMTPCMRLYAHLGTSLAPPAENDYAQWIRTYADPAFEQLARVLENLLDRHAPDPESVRATYRRAMELEVAFFDAALHPAETWHETISRRARRQTVRSRADDHPETGHH